LSARRSFISIIRLVAIAALYADVIKIAAAAAAIINGMFARQFGTEPFRMISEALTAINDGETLRYLASTSDCRDCPLKVRCCPKASFRRIPRSIYEEARDVARAPAKTKAFKQSRRKRKRVEMLFAHLKRILKLGRLRLRGPRGAQDEFTLAAIAQNLRRLAKLVVRPPPMVAACAT
jgi:hypothetical protein